LRKRWKSVTPNHHPASRFEFFLSIIITGKHAGYSSGLHHSSSKDRKKNDQAQDQPGPAMGLN
jgi:hypothetical protein